MSAAQWLTATQLRLGLLTRPRHATQCWIKRGSSHCCCALDDDHVHIANCPAGDVRHRPHDSVKLAVAHYLKRLGAYVDLEAFIPELYDHRDARMDLVTTFPGCSSMWLWDITVRSPLATSGGADGCTRGVKAKQVRYGLTVDAIALNHRGRLADTSARAIAAMAAASRSWC